MLFVTAFKYLTFSFMPASRYLQKKELFLIWFTQNIKLKIQEALLLKV